MNAAKHSTGQAKVALWMTFPVWSLIVGLALLSQFDVASELPGEVLIGCGAIAPVLGAAPIFRNPRYGPAEKAVAFSAYYLACAAAMFVLGWAALGLFGIAK